MELLVQQQKEDPCEGDVFDILFNLGDFEEFKDMMVAFKKEKEETPAESTDTANSVTFEVKRMRIFSEVSSCSKSERLPCFCEPLTNHFFLLPFSSRGLMNNANALFRSRKTETFGLT